MAKTDEDNLFWRVEIALAECMVKVATAHAKGGGQVVVLCSRKLTADQEGRLTFHGVKLVSTRGGRT